MKINVDVSFRAFQMRKSLFLTLQLLAMTASVSLFSQVSLTIQNREALEKISEPVTSGIPFARGAIPTDADVANVRLLVNGTETPAQFDPVAHWNDGSVRWLHTHFQANLPASGTVPASLEIGTAQAPFTGVTVTDSAPGTLTGTMTVETGSASFIFQKNELLLAGRNIYVNAGGNFRAVPHIVAQTLPDEPIALNGWTIENSGPMKAVIKVEGKWLTDGRRPKNIKKKQAITFMARLIFYRNHNDFDVQFVFRNNNSFGWDDGNRGVKTKKPAFNVKTISWNKKVKNQTQVQFLAGSKKYVFNGGVEKTIDLHFADNSTQPTVLDSRYDAVGTLVAGLATSVPTAPRILALCTPAYYASTKAWGMIAPPKTALADGADIADFNLFEKIQRAKVIQADVENPSSNMTGISLWGQLCYAGKIDRKAVNDFLSWTEYGSLRWAGNGEGTVSGNHYDWIYGMYLQGMRTGELAFFDAARVFAKGEIDFDIYHTTLDGNAFNRQKNWEARPIRNSPYNVFGAGRPTHTWSQGYALQWLISGNYRGRDAFYEIIDGIEQYLYESFNGEGHPDTSEIRTMGWITENLVNAYRINPNMTLATSSYGDKTIPQAIQDTLQNVFARETAAGNQGFVYVNTGDAPAYTPANTMRAPLQHCYFIVPAIKAYDEIFRTVDPVYGATLLALDRRITDWLISVTFGGDTNSAGLYRPRQIAFEMDVPQETGSPIPYTYGTIPYMMMAADAAGFFYSETGTAAYRTYARAGFSDCIRYFGVTPGDEDPTHTNYTDPSLRTPTAYNSRVFGAADGLGTESKINGWMNRFGQYYMNIEN